MKKNRLSQEFLQELANVIVEGNANFLRRKREIVNSGELSVVSNFKRTRRDFIDSWVKLHFEENLSSFDFVINERSVGFGQKFFEYKGLTAHGNSVMIIKNRYTLISGFEKNNTVHLADYAKDNNLLSKDESLNLINELLNEKQTNSDSQGDFAFLAIGYSVNPITDEISHLGVNTLDKFNKEVVELQDFSDCIVQPYTMESGTINPETTPPTEDYGLELREQSKENGQS
jgi:hypothetical protein